MKNVNPVAVISGPLPLSGRRRHAAIPQTANDPPTNWKTIWYAVSGRSPEMAGRSTPYWAAAAAASSAIQNAGWCTGIAKRAGIARLRRGDRVDRALVATSHGAHRMIIHCSSPGLEPESSRLPGAASRVTSDARAGSVVVTAAMRIVIADDNLLMREGIASLLRRAHISVVAEAGSADELLSVVDAHRPDAAIVDVRMPPTHTDEGLRAAHEIRRRYPGTGILILSQHVEVGTATQLLAERPDGLGYLLKDRVADIEDFVGTLRRVAPGGAALDPQVVSRLLARSRDDGPLGSLTEREREVLELVAEGRSNKGIADRLAVSERAVQKHVTAIFAKFGLPAGEDDNRRILAVLAYVNR